MRRARFTAGGTSSTQRRIGRSSADDQTILADSAGTGGGPSADDFGLTGAAVIQAQIATLPNGPGVYRMLDGKGEVLYVGKAKSLKKRLPAYTKPAALSARLQRMVALTRGLEVVTTANDVEALLLECNLIKRHRPPYNIVLRDDKSFPYIYVGKTTRRAAVPADRPPSRRQAQGLRLFRPVRVLGRGQRDARRAAARVPDPLLPGQHLREPHPALPAVSDQALHGALRRPDRCRRATRCWSSRPRRSSPAAAARSGPQLQAEMAVAAERLEFEQAAAIRDRLKALAHITSRQGINVSSVDDADVIALAQDGGQACVQVFFYRNGRNYGNRAYYPSHAQDAGPAELLEAFLGQFYSERPPPKLILLSDAPASQELLAEALAVRAGRKVDAGAAAARRAPPAGRARREPTPAWRSPASSPRAAPRRSCCGASPSGSTCRSRRRGSRSTTTATSWAPTRSAPSSSPARKD